MLNEDQSRAISNLSNAVTTLIIHVPGSDVAVKNILKQIEELSAPADVGNTLRVGVYTIDGSGWSLNVCDGAFSLYDDEGVVHFKAQEKAVPEAPPSFEDMLAKMDTREAYGLLSTLLFASKEGPEETARQASLVAKKLGIAVISL